ncbi:MAG: hypothetical protein WDO13_19515 [Verrucomicrobiota bacterium]
MALRSVHAHYDGKQILLDEPIELPVGRRLLVTLLDSTDEETDHYSLAMAGLSAAYGTNEPEYSEADLRP